MFDGAGMMPGVGNSYNPKVDAFRQNRRKSAFFAQPRRLGELADEKLQVEIASPAFCSSCANAATMPHLWHIMENPA